MAYDKVVDSAKLEAGLTRIADAIRNHVEDPGPHRVCQFPEDFVTGVADAYDAGRSVGHAEGSSAGYDVGYSEGLANGEQAEYDRFWDRMQHYGDRTDYSMAFCMKTFPRPSFDPKYDIRPTNAQYMFAYLNSGTSHAGLFFDIDLRNCGVEVDFSNCTSFSSMCNGCQQLVAIGTFDTRKATAISTTFYGAARLHTIERFILKDDGSQTIASNTFTSCNALENIALEGTIGVSVSFSSSKNLTHDSLMSIIEHLKNYAGSGTTHTVTLGTTNLNKLTADEKKIATDKGWTLA